MNALVNKKILIVEDDTDFLFILNASFVRAGFFVYTAQNGRDGLALAEKEKPDLILLDIMLPIMDGIEMAKQVTAKGIKSPITFLTNLSDVEHVDQAIKAAPADYIIKANVPVDKIVAHVKKKLGV